MIDAFVDSRGLVNYASLSRSPEFEAHVKQAAMLVHVDDAQLALLGPEFWINLYVLGAPLAGIHFPHPGLKSTA